MNIRKNIMTASVLLLISIQLSGLEIDQFTDREKYQEDTLDFTVTINKQTNDLLKTAIDNFNSKYSGENLTQKEIHNLVAFEICRMTAGTNNDNGLLTHIPPRVNLIYALGKIDMGPLQAWISSEENSPYVVHLSENFYSDIYPDSYNQNYIVKINGEFVSPDKIDHFFDQGYSYWIKSKNGRDERSAKEYGIAAETGWFGLLAGGVFSFADLRANWGGYQFYKNLFTGADSYLLVASDGKVSIRRDFSWEEHIDWMYDELKNPNVYSHRTMKRISRYIQENLDQYNKTYQFLKEQDFFKQTEQREKFYLTDSINYDNEHSFDLKNILSGL
ncbi:MAG: hypothetical protein JEY91_17755 [Spirochaetaceae bacterium]|nr:hypothetical protein [Spirochaetaceae bacterium]